jgi:DNA-binding NtrC family response regulator
VKQSGGGITVDSATDKGSTFSILLPATAESPHTVREHAAPVRVGTERVLLVEDQAEVRIAARRILVRAGYDVLETKNGIEALDAIARTNGAFDVIVTDAVMPHLNGADLVRELRATQPAIPVVIVSGYTDDELIWHGPHDPSAVFLQKPFRAETLLRSVRAALDARLAQPQLTESSLK